MLKYYLNIVTWPGVVGIEIRHDVSRCRYVTKLRTHAHITN